MTEPDSRLLGFLVQCRRIGRRRLLRAAGVDVLLGLTGLGLCAVVLAGVTRRGDLLQPLLVLGAASLVLFWSWSTLRNLRRIYGAEPSADSATATTVARTEGPLRRGGSDTAEAAGLRLEILGANELALALHQGEQVRSPDLVRRYLELVADRLQAHDSEPGQAVPRTRWRPRVMIGAVLVACLAGVSLWPGLATGLALLRDGADGRPPPPPQPVWSSLAIQVTYPPHTGRPPRTIPNPTGALRLPAGTSVHLTMLARERADAARVVVSYDADELGRSPEPVIVRLEPATSESAGSLSWTGDFVIRGSGRWTIVLLADEDDPVDRGLRRSDALPLELEPDGPPEIDLLPPSRLDREPSAADSIDLRIQARDDFGIARGDLVYQLPSGEAHSVPLGTPTGDARTWRHRHTWDLSQIPIEDRTELLYWVEVRDNDPGLGLVPLPDPPGKVTRSATMHLLVHDDEAEHAANIRRLSELRDMAVDQLGVRMTTSAFESRPGTTDYVLQLDAARSVLASGETLLAGMTSVIDALSMDTMAHERDIAILTAIHGRLAQLHRKEQELNEAIPPGIEHMNPRVIPSVLSRLGRHNRRVVSQLEDEIIRIDDLVDGQLIARLEALVARLRATQQKLVQLLEQLAAGDESVRPQIEQLKLRRREDLRRIAEARAMLHRQVGEEFMNADALELLRRMEAESEQSDAVDQELEQARGDLERIEQLHDRVQDQAAKGSESAQLSDEERQRMQLLRELSRLQDEENGLRSQTQRAHEDWRKSVVEQRLPPETERMAVQRSKEILERLDGINDARLGREGRRALEDAKEALRRLVELTDAEKPGALESQEAVEQATAALERAVAGSEAKEDEGQEVRRSARDIARLERQLGQALPDPEDVLPQEAQRELDAVRERQAGIRERASQVLQGDLGDPLPDQGRSALRRALQGMTRSEDGLERRKTSEALEGQTRAWEEIQRAIDSLRRGGRPPPRGGPGEASTEAEQDRSLRDQLMDAMREGAPTGFQDAVKHYYEELLR